MAALLIRWSRISRFYKQRTQDRPTVFSTIHQAVLYYLKSGGDQSLGRMSNSRILSVQWIGASIDKRLPKFPAQKLQSLDGTYIGIWKMGDIFF